MRPGASGAIFRVVTGNQVSSQIAVPGIGRIDSSPSRELRIGFRRHVDFVIRFHFFDEAINETFHPDKPLIHFQSS